MTRRTSTAIILGLLSMATVAEPCGDKLMVVARGGRTGASRSAPHRGAILLYAPAGSSVANALTGGDLKKGLERAGHRVRTILVRADLKSAMSSGSYDLVLADPKAVAEVEADVRGLAAPPTVIATLYDPTQAELAAANSAMQCVVKPKGSQTDYLTVVNEALTQRARTAAPKKASKKA